MPDICTYPFKHLTRSYDYGDRFDTPHHLKTGTLSERQVASMRNASHLAEMTPDTFKIAYNRRSGDADPVPFGFSRAELEAKGFTLRPPAGAKDKAKPVPPRPEAKAKPAPEVQRTTITLTEEAIVVGDYRIQPQKVGKFTWYDVTDASGRLLREKRFRPEQAARDFIAQLSTPAAGADTPAAGEQEEDDDGDVQSSADRSGQQGAPEAG